MIVMAKRIPEGREVKQLSFRASRKVAAAMAMLKAQMALSPVTQPNGKELDHQTILAALVMYARGLEKPDLERVLDQGIKAIQEVDPGFWSIENRPKRGRPPRVSDRPEDEPHEEPE